MMMMMMMMKPMMMMMPTTIVETLTLRREFVHLLEPRVDDHLPDVVQARKVVESDASGSEADQFEPVQIPGDDLQTFDRQRREIRLRVGILRPEKRRSAIHRTGVRMSRSPVGVARVLRVDKKGNLVNSRMDARYWV